MDTDSIFDWRRSADELPPPRRPVEVVDVKGARAIAHAVQRTGKQVQWFITGSTAGKDAVVMRHRVLWWRYPDMLPPTVAESVNRR
ncbi:MAG: hypothetical protein Alpg2KO_00370 [Alphaproteobacteria bacterium]